MTRLLISFLAIIILHSTFFIPDCLADTIWEAIGPFGGDVRAMVIDPTDSQMLYVGTWGSGVFKSSNGGAGWSAVGTGLADADISFLAMDPINRQVLYALIQGEGVFESGNSGGSWTAVNNGLPTASVDSLALDPTSSQVLYAGSYGLGVFRSTNGGVSWSAANNGLTTMYVYSLATDPASPRTVYAGTITGGIFKSSDGGDSWSAVNNGLTCTDIWSLVIDPANSQVLYAGTNGGGVFKSGNGGGSWSAANSGLTNLTVRTLAVDPTNSRVLYAGTDSGVFKSSDGGDSWTAVNSGLLNSTIRFLAIDPGNSRTLYVGTNSGVFKCCNGGSSWSSVNGGLTNSSILALAIDTGNSQVQYAGTRSGVFKSTNGGTGWIAVNNGLTDTYIWSLAIDTSNSQILYAGTYLGRVFKSGNGGGSWSDVTGGMTASHISSLVIDPHNNQVLYAGTGSGVFKSGDGGGSWNAVNSGLTNTTIWSLAIDRTNSKVLYAETYGGVFKSINGGGSWTAVTSGWWITTTTYNSMVIDPTDSQVLYAWSGTGVFKSINSGGSWIAVNNGLTNTHIFSLAIDPANSKVLYAGTEGGIFKSVNGGGSWTAVNSGLATTSVYSLAIDPLNSQVLYAGTRSGVFKTTTSNAPTISAPAFASFNIGDSVNFKVSASGWPTPTLGVSGNLPYGLSFEPASGIVSGKPLLGSAGDYTLLFTAGNGRPPDTAKAVTITISAPSSLTISIGAPIDKITSNPAIISGMASGTGLSSVSVQVTDGTYYLQPGGMFDLTPVWLSADGTTSWSLSKLSALSISAVSWSEGITYTVTARANASGTSKTTTASFRIQPSTSRQPAILSASFTPNTIRTGDSATLTGSLVTTDTTPIAGRTLKIIITPPSTAAMPHPLPIISICTTDAGGAFTSGTLSSFGTPGIYMTQVRFEGDSAFQATTQTFSLPVIAPSGYALIVVGKGPGDTLLTEHTATATNIYANLINKRGFLDEDIIPLVSSTNHAVTRQELINALAVIKSKYILSPAPVYLIMIDHGSSTGFLLGSDTLTPADPSDPANLGSMLDAFESGIDPSILSSRERFLIIGTCYSGIFQSLSKPGRIIITTTSSAELSLAGATSYSDTSSGLSGGDYFIDTLFSFLSRGDNFKDAFIHATTAVNLRDPRSVPMGLHSGVVDTLAQHPLLNDNGDAAATYNPASGGDGALSATLHLGEGVRVPTSGNPADVTETLPATTLELSETSATLWLKVNDNSRVFRAWAEIRTPDSIASSTGSGQVIPNFDSIPLIYSGEQWIGDFSRFLKSGRYDIYFYTSDILTGDISPMAHSVIYKKKSGNTPPASFALLSPANNSKDSSNQPVFMWQPATPAAGSGPVTYTFLISTSSDFTIGNLPPVEDIRDTIYVIPTASLKDLTSYYWKIRATDSFGATTDTPVWTFMTVNTGAASVLLYGIVRNADSMLPVHAAKVTITTIPATSNTQVAITSFGSYSLNLPTTGSYQLTVEHPDYQIATTPVVITSHGLITRWQQDIMLSTTAAPPPATTSASITWHHQGDGKIYGMTTEGISITGGGLAYQETNPAWQIVGQGDFDGDGTRDFVWQNNSTGQVYLMLMANATAVKSGVLIYTEPNTTWKIVATGDLNGDGTTDLIWWNTTTGHVYAMLINGTAITGGNIIYTEPDTNWKIVAAADFNGNNKIELLWWNSSTGQAALGQTNGTSASTATVIWSEPDTNWRIAGAGDLDGDGKADIIWHNKTTGQTYGMQTNGSSVTNGAMMYTEANTNWEIVSVGTYNGDNKADLLWWNRQTGQLYLMPMNGLNVAGGVLLYTEPDTTWRIQGETEWRDNLYGRGVTTTTK